LVQLAGTVAHELNNIFTAVNGNLSLLEESLQHQPESTGMIQDILKTARRGIELSQNLQAFAGRQALKRVTLDAGPVITAAVCRFRSPQFREGIIELQLEPERCLILIDPAKFEELVEELCRNAIAAGGAAFRLKIAVTRETLTGEAEGRLPPGRYVKFIFQDTGNGMSPEVLARALDPVFSTSGRPNRGWGLAKCAGFIRQCGGDIFLESAPRQGTCVKFYLPQRG